MVEITRLTSKGQLVIPERIRTGLGLKEGDRFIVAGSNDIIILKKTEQSINVEETVKPFSGIINKLESELK